MALLALVLAMAGCRTLQETAAVAAYAGAFALAFTDDAHVSVGCDRAMVPPERLDCHR
jgi:hypothetical protein